jgi:hypothetical protein
MANLSLLISYNTLLAHTRLAAVSPDAGPHPASVGRGGHPKRPSNIPAISEAGKYYNTIVVSKIMTQYNLLCLGVTVTQARPLTEFIQLLIPV